jgi:arylsulfatase A-like enzyme
MLSIPDPHDPNTVRPPYDTMFDGLEIQQPRTALKQGENLPSWGTTKPDKFNVKSMAQYFGMVKCIDDNVGKILDALREEGLLEKTVVVFTSDHGDMCGEHGRHQKSIPQESSSKIPLVIYAPGRIQPGAVVGNTLATVDFKPTILALLGVKDEGNEGKAGGRDASKLFLAGKAPADWKDEAFIRYGNGKSGWIAIFTSRYKLVFAPHDDPCLFDLSKDPDELKNVFLQSEYRETVRELARSLLSHCRATDEPALKTPPILADLTWTIEGTGKYTAPQRESAEPENNAE